MRMAKIDLSNQEGLNNLPESVREVFITSRESLDGANKPNLAKMNPMKVAREIDKICGAVERVDHKRSGSLLIVAKSHEQVKQLLNTTMFCNTIPVLASVAWGSQTVYGKIYAPEFTSESLEEILEYLKPCGVVGVRKFYQDPARANSPLYVLTFLKDCCPETIKVGYSIYRVDPYYPTPLRCGNCLRWGHSAKFCHGGAVCGNCGQKGHIRANCSEEASICLNCKGNHDAASRTCPFYIREQEICRVKVDSGISFKEARDRVCQNNSAQVAENGPQHNHQSAVGANRPYSTPPQASITNYGMSHPLSAFPTLTQLMARDSTAQPTTEAPSASRTSNTNTTYAEALSQPRYDSSQTSQDEILQSGWITAGQRRQSQRAFPERKHKHISQYSHSLQDTLHPVQSLHDQSAQPQCETHNASSGMNVHGHGSLPPHYSVRYPEPGLGTPGPTSCEPPILPSAGPSIIQVLKLLLPVAMRLFLCSTMTEKVECFEEVGVILGADGVVGDTLRKLGLSSLSHST